MLSGAFRAAFCPWSCTQTQNTVNYSAFTSLDLENTHVAALQKLRKYRRFLGRGAPNAANIARVFRETPVNTVVLSTR